VSSNINYLSINENFPVAGQDNDTQVFRDNFDTIKNSLREAKTEISSLQDTSADVTQTNNYNYKVQQDMVFLNIRDTVKPNGNISNSSYTIEYKEGPYHTLNVQTNVALSFQDLPGDPSTPGSPPQNTVGKLILEIYGDGTERTVTFTTSGGSVIKKNPGFSGSITLGADANDDPHFVEVWRHSSNYIFLNYLGQFS